MSPDSQNYERSVYTSLDLLGDVGGLYDALYAIAYLVIIAFKFACKRGSHNFIVPRLFKRGNSKLIEKIAKFKE